MKIYDISQEVFGCQVYPGDPMPEKKELKSMEKGEVYNLTAFSIALRILLYTGSPWLCMRL